ncbi:helix-turn-helix transcriptional regulator [Hyphomonas sp.]|uniref:helix-turn-helix transcriptional regulator n=1 Tax=Hyphomonas sp. TaxID=87 RepID=UPI00391DAAFA
MTVHKSPPASQFDLFAAVPARAVPAPPSARLVAKPVQAAPSSERSGPVMRTPPAGPVVSPAGPDEWWTTRMTCAFLKISRKTLWERRRDPSLDFPQPVQLGGTRNLYRARAVRGWAEGMAARETGS